MKIAVIGGGPAGMMAAIRAAEKGADVTLIEKNEKLGKKLYITGKGRCNVTNGCDISEFFDNIVRNDKFLYSALYTFTNQDAINFFEAAGVKLKEERGQRIFPQSDHSSDIIRALQNAIKEAGVRVMLYTVVNEINILDNGIELKCGYKGKNETHKYDKIIIATGGLSYQSTGSTGDGYKFAEKMGHKIVKPLPSLVPLITKETYVKDLEGLSLRNIEITIKDGKGREVYNSFGEMLFTSEGVSGPVILSASGVICRELENPDSDYKLYIDLKPALDAETLDKRILRDFEGEKNKAFKNSLGGLLPSKLVPVIVKLSGIDEFKKVNEVTRQERLRLVSLLKNFELHIDRCDGFNHAIITSGGVDVKKINPSTMESKLAANVFYAGEVLDADAFTGGFNIQIALSTGYLAGESAASD